MKKKQLGPSDVNSCTLLNSDWQLVVVCNEFCMKLDIELGPFSCPFLSMKLEKKYNRKAVGTSRDESWANLGPARR